MKISFNNIRTKITLPVVLIILFALTGLGFYNFNVFRNSTYDNIRVEMRAAIESVEDSIKLSEDVTTLILSEINKKNIALTRGVAQLIKDDKKNLTTENMTKIAKLLEVDEIHVADKDGILRHGNVTGFYGFDFASSDQSVEFMKILKNPKLTVAQAPTPRGIDGVLFQYVGSARKDTGGFVQIGTSAGVIDSIKARMDIQKTLETIKLGDGGLVSIVNNKGVVIAHTLKDYVGTNVSGYEWGKVMMSQDKGELRYIFDKTFRFVSFDKYNDYKIVSIMPEEKINKQLNKIRTGIVVGNSLVIILVILCITLFINSQIISPLDRILKIINHIVKDNDYTKKIDVKSNDELGVLGSNFNFLVQNFTKILYSIKSTAIKISELIVSLTSSSQETSSTANQQAAAVKEIVSTMEDVDTLSKSIEKKIGEITSITTNTQSSVKGGFSKVKESLLKMSEINEANKITIEGIKYLSERIDNIWDIVNIINGIADQTKIIAFNAELEASAAGEAGKNFQIVATEIRRLADSTVTSTNEIKERITEIQKSSDRLILTSEDGTEKIKDGNRSTQDINTLFEDILSSAEISSESTKQIAKSINQQVVTFEQILIAIKQISEGVDNIAIATKETSNASDELDVVSETLESIITKYTIEDSSQS